MEHLTTPPSARVWRISGGRLGEPGVAEDLCRVAMPGVEDISHALGSIIMVDRAHARLRVVSNTDRRESEADVGEVVDRVRAVTADEPPLTLAGPWSYQVAYSRFTEFPGRAEVTAIDQPLVRVTVGQGGTLAYPAVVDVLRTHTANGLAFPGCVGAMLLCDTANARVVGASFWADRHSIERTAAVSAEAMDAIRANTGATIHDSTVDEVLYIRPLPLAVP